MNSKRFLIIVSLLISFQLTKAQNCTSLGQNPETAFPVCGTAVFAQSSVGICGNRTIPTRCSGVSPFTDKNPYWYKFTCFQTGTLGFIITPNNLGDDYDWQLFDVTGRNPGDVYNDVSLFVACNWSGESGITGASPAGTSLIRCEGPGVPLFSSMPTIIQGRNYLLLISHFTDSQSGYSLSFGGGTASITDPTEPHLQSASAYCDGTALTVVLNKNMKCRTLSANGSEFSITPNIANVVSATGFGCTTGFDTDSLRLTLSAPLPPGNYTVNINPGSDGNTLLDNCDRAIPNGENIALTVYPIQPTPMDSITPLTCAPQTLQLVFRKNMKCSSIAPDGSDFLITGPYPVTIAGASGNCNNGVSPVININLSNPLYRAGTFTIRLRIGNDGNTLIDECGQETPAGQTISFTIKDTVNADFNYSIQLGCKQDTVRYRHNGANGVNVWLWTFGLPTPSGLQNPVVYYNYFGEQLTRLIVSNGFCTDTSYATVNLNNFLKAGFEGPRFICPNDPAVFVDTSIGNIRQWQWDFGNGVTYSGPNAPPQSYLVQTANYDVPVQLIVTDNIGCKDTAAMISTVVWNCYIAVPSAFTPNNDGLNDYLYPLNAYKAIDLKFSVYNRLGERVYYTEDWTRKWNGYFKGKPADTGTYVWMLTYIDADTRKKVFTKGSTVLIR